MQIKRGHLYVVDFNPRVRTKPGKLRPALVVQSNLVNEAGYPSTIVIPTTSKLVENPGILRLRLSKGDTALDCDSDLLLGQLRTAGQNYPRPVTPFLDRTNGSDTLYNS